MCPWYPLFRERHRVAAHAVAVAMSGNLQTGKSEYELINAINKQSGISDWGHTKMQDTKMFIFCSFMRYSRDVVTLPPFADQYSQHCIGYDGV
jgi:hypothetical protein